MSEAKRRQHELMKMWKCMPVMLSIVNQCALTHGLKMDMDKVDAIIFQGVVRFSWDVQVAVALLVTQVHLYP